MDAPTFTTSLGLVRWIGWAQRKEGEDWIRARELSHEQAFVLGYLVQNPGAIQRDIAQISRTSAASVSSLLQGLERRELVERRTEGGNERSKRVYATPAGVELIAGFDTAMAAADETILAPLDRAERATLHALLTKITAELRSRPADALRGPAALPAPLPPRRRTPARARACPERSSHEHSRPSNPRSQPTPSAPTAGICRPHRSSTPSCTCACRWPLR